MTTPLPPLEDLQALYEKATPGPWRLGASLDAICMAGHDRETATKNGWAKTIAKIPDTAWCPPEEQVANGELIVAAVNALPSLLTHLATLTARAQAAEGECEAAKAQGMDEAADFILEMLAKRLGLETFTPAEGSETWDGDVSGTLQNILITAGIIDEETGERATLARPASGPGEAVAWQYRRIGDVMWETWAWPSKPVGYAPENWEMRPLYAVPPADGYAKAEAVETAFRMGFMYGQGAKSSFTADDAWSLSETKLRTECKESDHA